MNELIAKQEEIIEIILKVIDMPKNGVAIDLDSLDDVVFTEGGKTVSPNELLKMFYETGVLIYKGNGVINLGEGWKDSRIRGLLAQLKESNKTLKSEYEKCNK